MTAQKSKNKIAYKPKTQAIKIFNSLDPIKYYERLLENPKTGNSRKLFLSENDFKFAPP